MEWFMVEFSANPDSGRCGVGPDAGQRTLAGAPDYIATPDRRYFVAARPVSGASANLRSIPEPMSALVAELMAARRALRAAKDSPARISARLKADAAKRALGERGEVWWNDGAPTNNRYKVANTTLCCVVRSACVCSHPEAKPAMNTYQTSSELVRSDARRQARID